MIESEFDLSTFKRPVKALATYYFIRSLLLLPIFPIGWLYRMCRYWTLQYDFDDEGIAMKWGVLWRREIHLTYRRIQDIHLTRNVIQRWMSLANVSVQTAGGSSAPEMVIEGAPDPEALRDVLYTRMRGSGIDLDSSKHSAASDSTVSEADASEAVALLIEIRDLLRERR